MYRIHQFKQLEGSNNYKFWKLDMKTRLLVLSSWEAVNNENFNLQLDTNKAKNYVALGQIILHVHESIVYLIRDCETARAAWIILKETFAGGNSLIEIRLRDELYNLRFGQFKNIKDMMDTIFNISLELATIGAPISEKDLCILATSKVPPVYKENCMSCEKIKDLFNFEKLKYLLMIEETKLREPQCKCDGWKFRRY